MVWQDQIIKCIKFASFKGLLVGLKTSYGKGKWLVVVPIGSEEELNG
jgi:hypothetical protein